MAKRVSQHARLNDQLCFALSATARVVSGAYRPMLAELGLTYPQYLTMLALWEQDGRTVTELSEALQLESNTISPILRRLQSQGLISKSRTRHDERVVHVHLTKAGRDLEVRLGPVRETVESATGLSPEQFTALRRRLHSLRETVAQSPPSTKEVRR